MRQFFENEIHVALHMYKKNPVKIFDYPVKRKGKNGTSLLIPMQLFVEK